MIIIALGSNISGPWGSPTDTLDRAVVEISNSEIEVMARSTWMATKPYGMTDQPAFVNGAVQVKTQLAPIELLKTLQRIEVSAGRERREKWGPRTLDLDIIAYNEVIMAASDNGLDLNLPHSDLHNRSFVLLPIQELNPAWRHPVSGKTVTQMLDDLAEKETF
jgi:2-amino-4-hydroxy-6-hydroxymethyldihydropteridine diphosphokinase